MTTAAPDTYGANPFVDPEPFFTLKLGGLAVAGRDPNLPTLEEVNGVKVEDEWAEDKGTSKSGAASKFKGTKPVQGLKIVLKAHHEASFAAFRLVWNMLAPVPRSAGGVATKKDEKAPGTKVDTDKALTDAKAAKAASEADPSDQSKIDAAKEAAKNYEDAKAGNSSADASAGEDKGAAGDSGFPKDDDSKKKKGDPDPGPKPPTVSIDNAIINYIGVAAVARKSFELKYVKEELSWEAEIEFVAVKPPTPAGAGVAGPKKPDAAVAGAAPKFGSANGGPSDAAADADAKIGMAAAKPETT